MYLLLFVLLTKISLISGDWFEAEEKQISTAINQNGEVDLLKPFSARSNIECTLKCQVATKYSSIKSVFLEDKQQCHCLFEEEDDNLTVDGENQQLNGLMPDLQTTPI